MNDQKSCFLIAPIGDPGTETRIRSDQILKHIITPAASECGYCVTRADQISEPGIITSQIVQRLLDDPLVIADLSSKNPNVYYELAIRHAIRKPCVQIIQQGENIPFDVSQSRTVQFDHHDLDSVAESKKQIVAQIKAVEQDSSQVDTAISVAIDLQGIRLSEKPEKRSLAEVYSILSDLRALMLSQYERGSKPFPPDHPVFQELVVNLNKAESMLLELPNSPLALTEEMGMLLSRIRKHLAYVLDRLGAEMNIFETDMFSKRRRTKS